MALPEVFTSFSARSAIDDPLSPYFLHHSDNPWLSLVSQALTEDNYGSWSRAMLNALSVKNKLGFIDGSIVKPAVQIITSLPGFGTITSSYLGSWIQSPRKSQQVSCSPILLLKFGAISRRDSNKRMGQGFFNCVVNWPICLKINKVWLSISQSLRPCGTNCPTFARIATVTSALAEVSRISHPTINKSMSWVFYRG